MIKIIRYSLFAFVFGATFLAMSVTETHAQLSEILRRMEDHNKSIQSIKAGVTMTKHNPQLNVSDVTVGTTSYLPKDGKRVMYARIDWTQPQEESIVVIGDAYQLYRPRMKQVITGKVGKAKNSSSIGGALGFMSMSREQLRANYDVTYIGEVTISGGVKTWHLQLTPLKHTSYKSAELWVDGNGMPLQSKIIEHNNDSTTVLLSNIRKNDTIKTSIFKLDLPRGVKEVKA